MRKCIAAPLRAHHVIWICTRCLGRSLCPALAVNDLMWLIRLAIELTIDALDMVLRNLYCRQADANDLGLLGLFLDCVL